MRINSICLLSLILLTIGCGGSGSSPSFTIYTSHTVNGVKYDDPSVGTDGYCYSCFGNQGPYQTTIPYGLTNSILEPDPILDRLLPGTGYQ